MFLMFLRAMGFTSLANSGKDALEKVKNVQETKGFSEVEKVAERVGLKKQTDKVLEIKDMASESFLDKTELAAETQEKAEEKPWWRRGLKWVIGGGFGLLLGKEILGNKGEEVVAETVDQGVEIATDEEKLKETNDTFKATIEAERSVKEVHKEIDEKWKFEAEKKEKNFFEEIEQKEKKYEKYGHTDAWKEAWEKTEFEYDKKTGEKTKRNFFWRLVSFFPALIKTYSGWRSFETLKKSGAIEKIKQSKEYKDKVEQKIHDAEEKVKKGVEAKKEIFSSVFSENPGAVSVSKEYLKNLANLMRNADKYSSAERAALIQKYATEAAIKGTKQFGPEFAKMKGLEEGIPGLRKNFTLTPKARGGFMLVEISGKALGAAIREGSQEGGWARAFDVFKEEVTNSDTWKDACPIWGTIRSAQRLNVDDDAPRWSKWLDFGLSAGMDVAMGVGMVASFGTLSAPLLAARTAAGAAAKGGIRKLAMRQLLKQGIKGSEKFASKELSKEARKGFTKQAVRVAGGKWGVRLNLIMTTIGEFFGEDIDEVTAEVKHEAYNTFLTPEQRYAIALEEAARTRGPIPEREAILAEEDKKQKKEIEIDEEKQEAGILSTTKKVEEDEEIENEKESKILNRKEMNGEKKKQKTTNKQIALEEIAAKITNQ